MEKNSSHSWKEKIVPLDRVISMIHPGMKIFLGTGVSEPRALVRQLLNSEKGNLDDLELIQLVSLGDALPVEERAYSRYRLKTFFAGWVAGEAITEGKVDLIPCRFSLIPQMIASGDIQVDAAFVQITPPDQAGYSSLGVSVDVARQAMEQASLVIGEINKQAPRTMGDTFVHVSDFDYLVESNESPIYFPSWSVDEIFERVAENVASLVEDGACLGFSIGPLYEALGKKLITKRDLGIHGPFVTDALRLLIQSGAVTNRKKKYFRRKSLVSYAFGSRELMQWLDRNPLMEFQGLDVVADPRGIGRNDRYTAILPARKVDLTGNIAMHVGMGNIAASPGEAQEFFMGASFSRNGKSIFALPSRNLRKQPNILLSVEEYPNQFTTRESLDFIVTEYGAASLSGRTIRERALALIEIAHPDDREKLINQAKEAKLLFPDQIYLVEAGRLYPQDLTFNAIFKDQTVRFRAIRPSDVDEMRRLFYRFSDKAVYYRYFSPIKTMPYAAMQEYVTIDYRKAMSIVGLVGEPGAGKIVAEARYIIPKEGGYADIAMVVDDQFQGAGLGSYLLKMLMNVARERGIKGFTADVLTDNKAMWKVLEKMGCPFQVKRDMDSYHIVIPLEECNDSTD